MRTSFERGETPRSSNRIASIWSVLFCVKDPHRISRRHLGFGGLLPRIEGPVLEAVERKTITKMLFRSFASASRLLHPKKQKANRETEGSVRARGMGVRIMTYCFKMT